MILRTQAELENYNFVNRVFHLHRDTYLFGNLECNVAPAFTKLNNDHGRPDFMKFEVNTVHNAIMAMANQNALVFNDQYVGVLNTVLGDEQFQRKDTDAGRNWVIDELVKRGVWPPTTDVVAQILIDAWKQLPDSAAFREAQDETNKRNAMIDAMTDGKTRGFSIQVANRRIAYTKEGKLFDAMAGQAQGFSRGISGPWSRGANSHGFADMTTDEISELFTAWQAAQNYKNMSTEDLRRLVRSNGSTDLFGKNVRPPSAVAPDDDVLLENPATPGKEFTRRDLVTYINAAPYNGRNLITRNGRIVPRLRQRFEEIIRGERG